jgi:hypothetical protein
MRLAPDLVPPFDPSMRAVTYRETASRLSAVGSQRIGVAIGSSAVKHSIDTEILRQSCGYRWLNAGTVIANVEDIDRIARLVLASDVKPRAILLGLHPDMIPATDNRLIDGKFRKMTWDGWKPHILQFAKDLVYPLLPTRDHLKYRFDAWVLARRRDLHCIPGASLRALWPPTKDPWHVELQSFPTLTTNDEVMKFISTIADRRNVLSPTSYTRSSYRAKVLDGLLGRLESLGVPVYIVVMPQHSLFRKALPTISRPFLLTALARHPRLILLDRFDAVSDAGFVDYAHLDAIHRERFTRSLARYIR